MRLITLLTTLSLASAGTALAFSQEDVMAGSIRSGWQQAEGSHMTALHLSLAPGWKTYWRNPGDAGIPPIFDWTGSENVDSVRLHWPRPHVFEFNGFTTVGYKGEFVLPIEVVPADPGRPIRLKGSVELGVCDDICLPATFAFDTLLSGAGAPDPMIDAALADRPLQADQAGLGDIGCTVDPIADGLRITATMALPGAGPAETVMFETTTPGVWVSSSETTRHGRTLTAVAEMVPPEGAPFALDRSGVTLTVISDNRAVEIRGCPAP